ncbi:tyrosine-type recombinase/integrase [Lactobacillus amylovorus]|uniref:tyrosine-type recombinase/integrase n=2 Tax=Bacilli TaxID=91061 RepID=UPI003F8A39D2
MAITKIKNGRNVGKYRVRIQPKDEITGKVISIPSKVTKTKSRKEAKELEEKMWVEYRTHQGLGLSTLNQTLYDGLSAFVKEEYDSGRWSSYSTYRDWKYTVKLVGKYFGKQKIRDVKEKNIRSFAREYVRLHKTTVAPHTTIDRQLQNLRCYFEGLKDYGLSRNPVPIKPLTKFFRKDEMSIAEKKYVFSKKEITSLKDTIIQELLSYNIRYWVSRIAIAIAIETGMRPQELQALTWDEIVNDKEYKVFRINDAWNEKEKRLNGHLKSRRRGEYRLTLPLSKQLLTLLETFRYHQRQYLLEHGLSNDKNRILLNLTDYRLCSLGYPISQKSMNEMIKRLSSKIKVDNGALRISMYTCRHTVATKLGNTPGISYPWVADRLGHSTKMFIRAYVHVDEDRSDTMLSLVANQL